MGAAASSTVNWRLDILPRKTRNALEHLSGEKWIAAREWYLAGGTALALYAGHRVSLDLDFFSRAKNIDTNAILTNLSRSGDWQATMERKNTVYGELLGAKASFIAYPFFIPSKRVNRFGFVRVLTPQDIAVMKIIAIAQRGRKRDFIDLYWYATHEEPLVQVIVRLKLQYPVVGHDYHHILKSLIFFDDAETDPMPILHFKASWREVKAFFEREIPRISTAVLKLNEL